MRELIYTILDLEEWCSKNSICNFCSWFENKDNKAVCQIRTRTKISGKLVSNDKACKRCKEKFEGGELPKCERCGRLRIKDDTSNGKYTCRCIERKEDLEEKELSSSPPRESTFAFYERQISSLHEELSEAEWTIAMEREEVAKFQEKSEEWGKRQKQELLDEIERLKKENGSQKAEIESLKKKLEQLNKQQSTQIEVPSKK